MTFKAQSAAIVGAYSKSVEIGNAVDAMEVGAARFARFQGNPLVE
jgi:hypothetical protein